MTDGLYDTDILAWSHDQANLLRRLGRGERVNDVDWTNLAEEIEALGRSELHAVESLLTLMLMHLLKLRAWPDSEACNHWRGEIVGFQHEANKHFTPSMAQKIGVDGLYAFGIKRLRTEAPNTRFPAENPFTLDHLLKEDWDALLACLPAA